MQLVELYMFQVGSTIHRFTSAKRAYSYLGYSFLPLPIGRSSISESGEIASRAIDVGFDISSTFGQEILSTSQNVYLTLFRAIDGDVSVWFRGDMVGYSHNKNVITLSFSDILGRTKRNGIRRVCSKLCPFVLYGTECGKVPSLVGATVSLVSGNTVATSAGFADGTYTNGILFFGGANVFILSQTGNAFTLKSVPDGLATGSTVSLLMGCDQTIETCRDRFSNLARYGGFPRVTVDNPFTTSDSL